MYGYSLGVLNNPFFFIQPILIHTLMGPPTRCANASQVGQLGEPDDWARGHDSVGEKK